MKKELFEKIKKLLKSFLVFERSKKTRNMLIARAVIYGILILVFFLNKEIYLETTKDGATRLHVFRTAGIIPISLIFVFFPVLKLKLPQRAVYSVQCLSIIGGMLTALWAGEHVFKYNWREMSLTIIIFNLMIIFALFTVFYLISNRLKFGILAAYSLTVLFAIVNYYVNKFRGEAINAADIYTVGTALNVIGDYSFSVSWEVFQGIYCGAMMLSVLTFLPAEKKRVSGWYRLFYVVPGTLMVIFIFTLFVSSEYPLQQGVKVKTFKPMKTYKTNGELLNFVRGFYYMRVFPPEDYSTENAQKIMENSGYVSDRADMDDGKANPNIIFIMNESLTDFTKFENVYLSEDPFEYIHSLQNSENAVVGELDVDVFGGRTANTEYETITGNSAAFFPANAVPYALYVRDRLPSMTWNMIDAGYCGNMAFHPYKANGYSRPRAYPNLGFTDFVSIESIEDLLSSSDYLRKVVSDSADFKQVIRLYEEARDQSDAPFFLFNVTMQNHGGYEANFKNFKQDIQVEGALSTDAEFKRFINLMDYSDEAFEELTAYFENIDEPTIIVMYGDHMPGLSTTLYNSLFGKSKGSMDSYEMFSYFRTPVVVWANYKINKDGKLNDRFKNISVNYLSSVVMDIAGVPMTAYQKFLSDMQKVIPSFTLHGYLDKNGIFYEVDNLDSPYYKKWVNKYHYFEYNNQFDEGNRVESFFSLEK